MLINNIIKMINSIGLDISSLLFHFIILITSHNTTGCKNKLGTEYATK